MTSKLDNLTLTDLYVLIVFVLLGTSLYFLPYFVAKQQKKRNLHAIFVLNLLLGWTFIGWVIALIWAFLVDDLDLATEEKTIKNEQAANPNPKLN